MGSPRTQEVEGVLANLTDGRTAGAHARHRHGELQPQVLPAHSSRVSLAHALTGDVVARPACAAPPTRGQSFERYGAENLGRCVSGDGGTAECGGVAYAGAWGVAAGVAQTAVQNGLARPLPVVRRARKLAGALATGTRIVVDVELVFTLAGVVVPLTCLCCCTLARVIVSEVAQADDVNAPVQPCNLEHLNL